MRRNFDTRLQLEPSRFRQHFESGTEAGIGVPPSSHRIEASRASVAARYRFFIMLLEVQTQYDCDSLTPSEIRNLAVNLGFPQEPVERITTLANKVLYGQQKPTEAELVQMLQDIRSFE